MKRLLIIGLLSGSAHGLVAAESSATLRKLYEDFHREPELSLQEKKTSARLAKEFKSLGVRLVESIGGHGVVAVIENGAGPVLMLRADSDALPVREETGLPYASKVTQTDSEG